MFRRRAVSCILAPPSTDHRETGGRASIRQSASGDRGDLFSCQLGGVKIVRFLASSSNSHAVSSASNTNHTLRLRTCRVFLRDDPSIHACLKMYHRYLYVQPCLLHEYSYHRRGLVLLAGANITAHSRQRPKIPKYRIEIHVAFFPSERSECCFTHFVLR